MARTSLNVDLLVASRSQDDVEFVLLFSSGAGVTAASRASNCHSSGSLDAFFFEKIVQFLGFKDGQRKQFFAEFSYISHLFNSLSCSVCQFVSGE